MATHAKPSTPDDSAAFGLSLPLCVCPPGQNDMGTQRRQVYDILGRVGGAMAQYLSAVERNETRFQCLDIRR